MYIISAETINNVLTLRDHLYAWHRMHWQEWSTQPPMQVWHVYNICRDNKLCINTEGSFVCLALHALARIEYPTPVVGELQKIFECNAYLPPYFLLNADFQNLKLYFHPLYSFAMRKSESITVLKRIYVVLCRFKHIFSSDLLLRMVLYCKKLFL